MKLRIRVLGKPNSVKEFTIKSPFTIYGLKGIKLDWVGFDKGITTITTRYPVKVNNETNELMVLEECK